MNTTTIQLSTPQFNALGASMNLAGHFLQDWREELKFFPDPVSEKDFQQAKATYLATCEALGLEPWKIDE